MHRRFLSSVAAAALLVMMLAGPAASQAQSGSGAPGRMPEKLILGLVPSVDANALITNAKPLADYLSTTLGIPVESVVPTDYAGLVVAMGTGQADIGLFGPLALLQAADQSGADIILQSVRNGSTTYHTQWFTNKPETYCGDAVVTKVAPSQGEDTPRDVTVGFCNGADTATAGPLGDDVLSKVPAGSVVSFTQQSSASGYVIPALQLLNAGVDPVNDIQPLFSNAHEASVAAVCKGDAEVGVSFNDARLLAAAVNACGPDMSKTVVFALSPEIPNDGVAVAGDLDAGLKQQIKDALLAYGESEEGSAVLTKIYRITNFVPVDLEALDVVREAVQKLGLD